MNKIGDKQVLGDVLVVGKLSLIKCFSIVYQQDIYIFVSLSISNLLTSFVDCRKSCFTRFCLCRGKGSYPISFIHFSSNTVYDQEWGRSGGT